MSDKTTIFAVAPMMDWTDRHCRFFHRQLSREALLYTEMVVADALLHGDVDRLLAFNDCEHPVALQLGGSDPLKLVEAARIGASFGYDEINLNVGCPSDRVQSGTFGACLMREPDLVARCIAAMKGAVDVPVTVKCRIGVDEQDTEIALDDLTDRVFAEGCDALWVHARKAWLQGLSPKENRDIPPLDYGRVHRLKERWPDRFIGINGGIDDLDQAEAVSTTLEGVMLGRAAYHQPALLTDVDARFYGREADPFDAWAICAVMQDYVAAHLQAGGRVSHVTRHMLGLFAGQPGARQYRRIMSVDAAQPGAGPDLLERAFGVVDGLATRAA